MALVFNKKQLISLVKIMETYDLSDESEWVFPLDKDYFCELQVPIFPTSDRKNSVVYIHRIDR